MARLLAISLTVVLIECGAAVLFGRFRLANADRDGVPCAVLATATCDFGEVRPGGLLTARFPIENRGTRRLVLTEFDRSCDCVRGDRPEVVVGPGRSAEIGVRFDTEELAGPVQLEIRYSTNDPALPTILLHVLADVETQTAR